MPSMVGSRTCVQTHHGRSVNANMTYNGSFKAGDSKLGVIGRGINDNQSVCCFRARGSSGELRSAIACAGVVEAGGKRHFEHALVEMARARVLAVPIIIKRPRLSSPVVLSAPGGRAKKPGRKGRVWVTALPSL